MIARRLSVFRAGWDMSEAQRRILLIDDDPDLRTSLAEALEEVGFQVTSAANGQLAMTALSSETPELILLDLLMPVMNGWQFCRAIKQEPRTATIPVIAMSAAVSKDPGSPYYLDVDDFVPKPLELDDLLVKIAAVLDGGGRAPRGKAKGRPPQRL
jgi:CheY-like chemotaxis protein